AGHGKQGYCDLWKYQANSRVLLQRRWDYEPIFLDAYSSDESKMIMQAKIQRLPRGLFGFSGIMDFLYDTDDTTIVGVWFPYQCPYSYCFSLQVEATAYRSTTGNDDDYKLMPWKIPKQTFKSFLKTFYDDIVLKNFANCTENLPESPLDPWPRIRLEFNTCVPNGEGMPEIAPQGYYKVVFAVVGEVDWGFVSTCRVFDKLV
ncbi:hypothetical protein KR222_007015, partial [Zaprionus bogoriensis]